jgi:hypothetical protein
MENAMETEPQRTLLPRFSIRSLLLIVTGCSLVFVVVGMAAQGRFWAWGVTVAMASLVLTALVHAALFGIVWMFSTFLRSEPKDT